MTTTSNGEKHIYPVEKAANLDNRIRRWFQNPRKILRPYIDRGMTVLDVGCGPGFFTIDMAKLVGKSGRVIAADLQRGMLQKIVNKIKGTGLEGRITIHKCEDDKIGVSEPVDFVLLFYVAHEIAHQAKFFCEIRTILKPNGQILIVEPPFHVSKLEFKEIVVIANNAGFANMKGPNVLFSKTVILKCTENS